MTDLFSELHTSRIFPLRENIKRLSVKSFTMGDVDQLGIVEVTSRALDHASLGGKRPIHISFDVDCLDDLEIGKCTGTSGNI